MLHKLNTLVNNMKSHLQPDKNLQPLSQSIAEIHPRSEFPTSQIHCRMNRQTELILTEVKCLDVKLQLQVQNMFVSFRL